MVGKENAMSFHSAPHGAGRRYSRTKARSLFKMEDLSRAMEGIEFRKSKVLLDEIPAGPLREAAAADASEPDRVRPLLALRGWRSS